MAGEYAAIALQLIYERFVEKEKIPLPPVTDKLVVGEFCFGFFSTCFFLEQRWIGKKTSGEKVDSHDTLTLKVGQKKHRKLRLILNGTGGGTGTFFMCHWTRLRFYSKHDFCGAFFFFPVNLGGFETASLHHPSGKHGNHTNTCSNV